jgi:predicted peroxiredoxin
VPGNPLSTTDFAKVPSTSNPGENSKQKLLFYTASSTDAPHRAVLPLIFATKAREKGHDSTIFLAGDGVLLMKSTVAADIKAVGQPAAAEVLRRAVELMFPFFV